MIRNRMVIAKKRNFGALNALVKVQSRIRMLGPRRIYLDRIAVIYLIYIGYFIEFCL